MSEVNSLIDRTYFAGDSRMPVPPEYFLQRLYDYDAMLVMFPSVVRPGAYVLARRREHSAGISNSAVGNPDTNLCVAMGWVPVCVVMQSGANWNPEQIIAKLTVRDIRAQGGAEKVAARLEQQEADDETARQKAVRQDLWDRSGEGWRSYQARTGASSIKFHDNYAPKAPVSDSTVSSESTPRSTAGLGANTGATIGGEVSD